MVAAPRSLGVLGTALTFFLSRTFSRSWPSGMNMALLAADYWRGCPVEGMAAPFFASFFSQSPTQRKC